jgi:hypothetical protein
MSLQPGTGFTFSSSGNGTNFNVQQPWSEWSPGGTLEQFQIVVSPYSSGEGPPTQSLIRVVKGEVVWSPKLLQTYPLIPIPISATCTSQMTITEWYGDLPYVVEVDDQEAYIGNGGLLVSNSAINIGIFIFKATGLPTDIDPIIIATPDFTPSCPVEFPGIPPIELAFWDVVKIGSVSYTTPDPETGAGGWAITQNFIGSMTLPGDGKGDQASTPQLPGQLYYNPGTAGVVAPFEFNIVNSNGVRYLQIGKGTASYSESNMPSIWYGANTHIKQALFTKVQITTNARVDWETIWPYGFPDEDPSYSLNMWMEDGGGYVLGDTNDPVVLYAFKWDCDNTLLPGSSTSPVLSTGLPTLALIASSNSADYAKINKDNGPSVYEQTMNVKPMTGYDADSTGLANDWGHCHTTWLNPRKIGYNCKAIATVVAESNSFSCLASIDRVAIPFVQNMVQGLYLLGDVQTGSITFTCGFSAPSAVPFPAVSTIVPGGYGSVSSDEITLAACLNSIVGVTVTTGDPINPTKLVNLAGNVQVAKATLNSYYITFVNELQGVNVPVLVPITTAVVPYTFRFKVVQYHTGMLDLTTPMQMGMTQLMNKADQTEADDPYNKNVDGTPRFKDIVNRQDVIDCKDFAGSVTFDGVYSMSGFTNNNPDFTIADSCGDSCDFPFQVRKSSEGVWTVCEGMVNNQIPSNNGSDFTVTDGFIYLEIPYDVDTKAFPQAGAVILATGETMPDSDAGFSYVAIAHIVAGEANQLVTGSLWGDRIQVGAGGTETAYYYYAQV